MILINDRRERQRFIKFAAVGVSGFVVDFLTFNILRSLGIPPQISSILSFFAAVSSNFTINRYWTYRDSRSKRVSNQIVQYGLVSLVGLTIRTVIFNAIYRPMVSFFVVRDVGGLIGPEMIGENIALATVVLTVMFWNFFANRFWTYNDVE